MNLREHIHAAAHRMPLRGGYNWPSSDKSAGGCLADLRLGGVTVLKAGRGTYCCGITLEMFWRGWESFAAESGAPFMGGLSADRARTLQRAWFCIGTRRGALDALVPLGLGVQVRPEDAQPGDFAQLWRPNGTGHSVLVLSLARGRISYLSTQRSTDGIGAVVEPVPAEVYIVRPIVPPPGNA